jgi:hypothetical protein
MMCHGVSGYWLFGRSCCLHLHVSRRLLGLLNHWKRSFKGEPLTIRYSVSFQRTWIPPKKTVPWEPQISHECRIRTCAQTDRQTEADIATSRWIFANFSCKVPKRFCISHLYCCFKWGLIVRIDIHTESNRCSVEAGNSLKIIEMWPWTQLNFQQKFGVTHCLVQAYLW